MSFKTINLEKINAYLAGLSLGKSVKVEQKSLEKSVKIGQFSLGKSEEGHILHVPGGSFSYAFFLQKTAGEDWLFYRFQRLTSISRSYCSTT